MIRKQLYLAAEQQRKIRKLAFQWQCSEAEVVRQAVDRLPDPDTSVESCLAAAGLLAPVPIDDDLPTDSTAIELLEREWEAWVDAQPSSLWLSDAVIEDRD
jgi:hypothetical protein